MTMKISFHFLCTRITAGSPRPSSASGDVDTPGTFKSNISQRAPMLESTPAVPNKTNPAAKRKLTTKHPPSKKFKGEEKPSSGKIGSTGSTAHYCDWDAALRAPLQATEIPSKEHKAAPNASKDLDFSGLSLVFSTSAVQPSNVSDVKSCTSLSTTAASAHHSAVDGDDDDDEWCTALTIDEPTTEKKKPRRKKSMAASVDEIPEEVLKLVGSGIDDQLDEKAQKNKLTAKQVKNIIKSVMSNDDVLAMVRNTLMPDCEGSLLYEPKRTRAKTKEHLSQLPPQPPQEAPLTLGSIDFPDDEDDDDEYRPDEHQLLSDEESILSSTVGSDATFTSPLTCRSPTYRPSPLAATTTPGSHTSSRHPPTPHSASASGQKRGAGAASLCPRAVLNNAAVARTLNFDQQPELISERTRSKLPLSDTPLEVLESQLVPPDATPDLYYEGPPMDEKEWRDFLQDLVRTQLGGDDCRDEDNVQEDPDFDLFQNNDIEISDIKEELRKDKAVKISKRELNSLRAEYLDGWVDEAEDDSSGYPCGFQHVWDAQLLTTNTTTNNTSNNNTTINNDNFIGEDLNDFMDASGTLPSLDAGGSMTAGTADMAPSCRTSGSRGILVTNQASAEATNQASTGGTNNATAKVASQASVEGTNEATAERTNEASAEATNQEGAGQVPRPLDTSAALPRLPLNRRVTRSITAAVAERTGAPDAVKRAAAPIVAPAIPDCSAIRVEIQVAEFSAHQLAVLRRQMVEHVQLLATSVMMCCGSAGNQRVADSCLHLLRLLNSEGKAHQLPGGAVSFFHAPNLMPAFAAVARLRDMEKQELVRRRQLYRRGLAANPDVPRPPPFVPPPLPPGKSKAKRKHTKKVRLYREHHLWGMMHCLAVKVLVRAVTALARASLVRRAHALERSRRWTPSTKLQMSLTSRLWHVQQLQEGKEDKKIRVPAT